MHYSSVGESGYSYIQEGVGVGVGGNGGMEEITVVKQIGQ